VAVVTADLLSFVGAGESDTAFAAKCVDEADALVTHYVGDDVSVPVVITDRAVLAVAAELFNQRSAPNGIANYSDEVGNLQVARVARDPMRAAYPLLLPFLAGNFA
jgi:hypothetical protein